MSSHETHPAGEPPPALSDTGNTTVRRLTAVAQIASASNLVSHQIADVRRSRIASDSSREFTRCRSFMVNEAVPLLGADRGVMLGNIWVGAFEGTTLVGAVHACALYAEADDHIQRRRSGLPGAGSVERTERFLNRAARIEELAVLPHHRNRGIGSRLLAAVHHELRHHHHPRYHVRSVQAFATTAAHPVFEQAGYTFTAPRRPVPAEYADGLPSLWDRHYDSRDGAHCYGHLADLA